MRGTPHPFKLYTILKGGAKAVDIRWFYTDISILSQQN